jgi:hypothetical protein
MSISKFATDPDTADTNVDNNILLIIDLPVILESFESNGSTSLDILI